MEIKGKIVLVTGASKGIGRAIAIALSKAGANVIINFKTEENLASGVLKECNNYSKNNSIIKADITDEKEVSNMFDVITKKYKKLDILINNAGIFDESDSPTNLKVFERIFSINFLAQARITKFALKILNQGKIINISSTHGRIGGGRPNAIAYASMKAALDSYTKNLAKDLAPKILVNSIAPGRTLTPIWGELKEKEKTELASGSLIKRWVSPEEIADGAIFLIKNDAVCGEILTIDGGRTLMIATS